MALRDNMVSWWELNETSGTRNDSHGTNHLTDNNTVLSGTGKQGNCADFESANAEYLSIADASQSGLDNQTNMSFSWWMKLESDTDPVVMGKFATGSQAYWIQMQLGGTFKFMDSSEGDSCQISLADFTLATWYHVVVTYAAGVVKLYVNGSYVGTDNTTNTSIPNTTGYFSIGRVEKYASNYYDGLIDEVGIWSRELTSGEVTTLYNSGNGLTYAQTGATAIVPSMATLGVGA